MVALAIVTLIIIIASMAQPALVQGIDNEFVVTMPLVTNGELDPLYAYAPAKPFWRRQTVTPLAGHVSGTAIVTGLQTIVIRYYRNSLQRPLRWYLVASWGDDWIAGELLRFGTFVWDDETALILIVPTTHRLTLCVADSLIAITSDGWVCGRAIFPDPCKESWCKDTGLLPTLRVLRFWK